MNKKKMSGLDTPTLDLSDAGFDDDTIHQMPYNGVSKRPRRGGQYTLCVLR